MGDVHRLRPGARKRSYTLRLALRRPFNFSNPVVACLAAVFLLGCLVPLASYTYYRSIITEAPLEATNSNEAYTIVILSQPHRLATLRTVVEHYGRCPSVREILVVWGPNPPSTEALGLFSDVPVRLRGEGVDSLNNRFRPDPKITTKAVLSLDDDTIMWCSDVEAGFREWLRRPQDLVGFFPRLILPPASRGRRWRYFGEKEAYRQEKYNAMLTVAMFYNSDLMREYWADDGLAAYGRGIVDLLFNCEDILMNYVAVAAKARRARKVGGKRKELEPAVRYVRARRRLDLSMLTSVGISRGAAHQEKREQCATAFFKYINETEGAAAAVLPTERFDWDRERAGPPLCWIPFFGCIYL